jgi:hypothetical protein
MDDQWNGLGARLVQAARLAVALHLKHPPTAHAGLAQRVLVGGADRNVVTEDTLSPAGCILDDAGINVAREDGMNRDAGIDRQADMNRNTDLNPDAGKQDASFRYAGDRVPPEFHRDRPRLAAAFVGGVA